MLLQVVGSILASAGVTRADDDYIPLTFRAQEGVLPSPYVWQAHGQDKLLEVSIERDSNVPMNVTLVVCHQKRRAAVGGRYDRAETIFGLPIVRTEAFRSNPAKPSLHPLHGHHDDFGVVVSGHDVFIELDAGRAPDRCYRVDRVGFLASAHEIVGIAFFDLTETELLNLDRLVPG